MKHSYLTKSRLFHINFYQISSLLTLDKNLFTGAVLMDLPKASVYIPHNLLLSTNCLSVFDHFVQLALKGLKELLKTLEQEPKSVEF